MATDKVTLKNWFKKGLKPLATQFEAWIDSYWHKDESIPMSKVNGLQDALNGVPSQGQIDALSSGKEDKNKKGVANGYASLNEDGKVPVEQLPEIGSGSVESITGTGVDNTDPENPVIEVAELLRDGVPSGGDTLNKLYNLIVSLGELVGGWNTASLPTTGSGAAGAIDKGDYWRITGTITIAGIGDLKAGDMLIASVANASVAADFFAVQNNVDQATTSVLGLVKLYTDLAASNTDGAPSQAAVVTGLALKKDIANAAPATVTTSGSLTINSVSGSLLTLDCASKEESKFKYVGDTTPLSIALDNFPEGAYCILTIERTSNANMSIRFKNKTYLLSNTQLIGNGNDALVVRGRSSGRTVAVLGFYCSGEVGAQDNQGSPATTNLVNTLKFVEDTQL